MKEKLIQFLSLFTSTGTLICCALPALLAVLAGGAAVSSLISIFPWLVPLSQHKVWIFLTAGVLTVISGYLTFKSGKQQACDVEAGETGCENTEKFRRVMFYISAGILAFATFFTYALTPILRWIDEMRGVT